MEREKTFSNIIKRKKYWSTGIGAIAVILVLSLGLQFVDAYKDQQRIQKLISQVMEEVVKDREAKKLLGENYSIASEPPVQTIPGVNDTFPVMLTFYINTESGLVFLSNSFNEDHSIDKTFLTSSDGKQQIIIQKSGN